MIQKTIQLGNNPECVLECMLHEPERGGAKRPAVIVCPGGAFAFFSPTEGTPVAAAFFSHGFHAFVLRYSLNFRAMWPTTTIEAGLAIMELRKHAEEWDLDPNGIAIGGFSAGGTIGIDIGTCWDDPEVQQGCGAKDRENRPDALFLFYPAANVEMPAIEDGQLVDKRINPAALVNENTPPAFMGHTYEDNVVSMMQSIRLAEAFSAHNVPMELHIFTAGEHGTLSRILNPNGRGGERTPDMHSWMDRCCEWLRDQFYHKAPPLDETLNPPAFVSRMRRHETELANALTAPSRFGPQETEEINEFSSLGRFADNEAAMAVILETMPKLQGLKINDLARRQSLGKWMYYAGFAVGDPARDEIIERLRKVMQDA